MDSCQRCAHLEERVAWLESELGIQRDAAKREALRRETVARSPHKFGRGGAADVVLALYEARGRVMSFGQILEAVPPRRGGSDERRADLVKVFVCVARKTIGKDAIDTIWGVGYRLTPAGMRRVAQIVGDTARQEAA